MQSFFHIPVNLVINLMTVVILSFAAGVVAADPVSPVWKSADGKFGLVSASPSKIVLVKLENQKQFEGTWLKMALPIRQSIAAFWADQDKEQLIKVRKALVDNKSQVKGAYEQLKALHSEFPMSPYAGLALGVSYAGLLNDPDKATAIFKQVVLRLETQRGANPGAHQYSLASCYCDLAVCSLKNKKAENGLGYLIKAIDTHPMPVAVHNSSQLLLLSQNADGYFKLNDMQHSKLSKVIEGLAIHSDKLSAGWYYSLAINEVASSNVISFPGNLGLIPPIDGCHVIDVCLGVAVAENTVVLPSKICERGLQDSILLTYALPQNATSLVPIEDVSVEVENVSTSFQSSMTRFKPAVKTSSEKLGVAAFRTTDNVFQPSAFNSGKTESGQEVQVYLHNKTAQQKIDMTSVTTTIKWLGGKHEVEFSTRLTAEMDSPFFDKSARWLGFASQGNSPKLILKASTEIKTWLERSARFGVLENSKASNIAADCIVPIVAWAKVDASPNAQALVTSGAEFSEVVRDEWCIPCDGKGFFRCPNCLKGVASYKEMEQVGINQLNKSPIFAPVVKTKPCEACNAKGGTDCPHCTGGRISR